MIKRYLVTVQTPKGDAELEVPTLLGPDAAARRAMWSAVAIGWGDVNEVTVLSTVEITKEVPA